MPTVTVLAWCLIASTGRVSSSMPAVSAAVRSSTTRLGRADRAVLDLVHVEGHDADGVAQQRRDAHRGAGLEVAVVAAGAQAVEEGRRRALDGGSKAGEDVEAVVAGRDRELDRGARLAQRSRRRVDRERGLVAEEVAGHGREHERDVGVHRGHRDGLERGVEPAFAVGGDHDRRRPVGAVDRDLLGHVVGVRPRQPRRAHQDQRLGRQVDVLLVLGGVAGRSTCSRARTA